MLSFILGRIIYFIVFIVHKTLRYQYIDSQNRERAKENPTGTYLFALWHQNILSAITAEKEHAHVAMASRSKDADPVEYILRKLGHICVRGSSRNSSRVDKGGKAALEEMVELVQSGVPAALSVDGPKGPIHVVKPGIVELARRTGAKIVPYCPYPEHFFSFKSWDKFRFPRPFSKVIVVYGPPITVEQGVDNSVYVNQIAEALLETEKRAVALVNVKK